MRIAILGAGKVGGTLGRRFAEIGHLVAYGVRDPKSDSVREVLEATRGATASTPGVAVAEADVVVLALPFEALESVLPNLAPRAGTVLIDATNPIRWNDGPVPALSSGSAADIVASHLPDTRVVKAFNTVGWEVMHDPRFGERAASMPMCGDDQGAKAVVSDLARAIGFAPVDAGPLRNAALIERMAVLWIHLATVGGLGREFAFCLAER